MALSTRPPKRLKTLNGAPLVRDLEFKDSNLLKHFLPAIQDFIDGAVSSKVGDDALEPRWRHISSAGTRLRTGWSQPYLPEGDRFYQQRQTTASSASHSWLPDNAQEGATFENAVLDSSAPRDDAFAQDSLIFHDNLVSSQIVQDQSTVSSSSFMTTSFSTNATDESSFSAYPEHQRQGPVVTMPATLHITQLASLPPAQRLRSIYPQTPTPNFLCVLTAIEEPRELQIKKSGRRMVLHELIVADDTAADFKISFWLPPQKIQRVESDAPKEMLRQTLDRLKVGDILLLRNIALSVYRDTVYGQSLNLSITRARTTIDVLMRDNGVFSLANDTPGEIRQKFEKVKKWAKLHVAPDYQQERKRKRLEKATISNRSDDMLPPDTMET